MKRSNIVSSAAFISFIIQSELTDIFQQDINCPPDLHNSGARHAAWRQTVTCHDPIGINKIAASPSQPHPQVIILTCPNRFIKTTNCHDISFSCQCCVDDDEVTSQKWFPEIAGLVFFPKSFWAQFCNVRGTTLEILKIRKGNSVLFMLL